MKNSIDAIVFSTNKCYNTIKQLRKMIPYLQDKI